MTVVRIRALIALVVLALVTVWWTAPTLAETPLKIGSKRFTESYVLGEILLELARRGGPAEHRMGLGNTAILYAALTAGSIDVYPEYTGTIAREILKREDALDLAALNAALAPLGLAASVPLGFNNTYAMGVREDIAAKLGLRSIADLAAHPQLRAGFSHEFLARKDGWAGLARTYGLAAVRPAGLDHGLAYAALEAGRIDVMDVYSTDAKVLRYRVRTLADDRGFFPRYDAVLLHRADVPARFPQQWRGITTLAGTLDEARMTRLNAAAELEGRSFAQAASLYFAEGTAATKRRTFLEVLLAPDLARLTREHLLLVFGSVAASVLAGVPLGIAAARRRWLACCRPFRRSPCWRSRWRCSGRSASCRPRSRCSSTDCCRSCATPTPGSSAWATG